MKKLTTAALFLMLTGTAFAQEGRVGINTETPKTTFDVNGKKDGSGNLLTTDVTGMQAPRLTRAELTAKGDVLYGADQKGALVYITDVTAGDALTQRINITAAGYYYFDGTVWQKMSGSGSAGGDPTTDAWVDDATNTMVKLGTTSTGAARTAGTEFVALDNGNVGIGTNNPTHDLNIIKETGMSSIEVEGNSNVKLYLNQHFNGVDGADVEFRKSRGTISSPSAVQDLDQIGGLRFSGYNGTSYTLDARIYAMVDGVPTGTIIPTKLRFITKTPTGSLSEKMTITSIGNVGIGTTAPTSKLQVVGLPIHVDNTAALAAGLTVGAFYHAGDGIVRVVF